VLSEGVRRDATPELVAQQRSLGGENDAPSRNLSRFLDRLADELALGLDVMQVWRNDRFGRGGDHTEFLNQGFPAVRFSVAIENYNWQHQDLRTENGIQYGDTIDHMDFPSLRRVTQINVAALAALARAPMPPTPTVEGAVSTDTTLTWAPVEGAADYVVRWRRTDSSQWEQSHRLRAGGVNYVQTSGGVATTRAVPRPVGAPPSPHISVTLPHIRVDDWVFGVSSVSADGWESPVASAVPGGAFAPYAPPPPAAQ
jgi:hypothetical protein